MTGKTALGKLWHMLTLFIMVIGATSLWWFGAATWLLALLKSFILVNSKDDSSMAASFTMSSSLNRRASTNLLKDAGDTVTDSLLALEREYPLGLLRICRWWNLILTLQYSLGFKTFSNLMCRIFGTALLYLLQDTTITKFPRANPEYCEGLSHRWVSSNSPLPNLAFHILPLYNILRLQACSYSSASFLYIWSIHFNSPDRGRVPFHSCYTRHEFQP